MSSSWIAPNEGAIAAMVSTMRAGSFESTRIGTAVMPTSAANSADLPSMTGRPASGPMSPRPRTAVPLVTTATVFGRLVYRAALAGSSRIARHTRATPGV